MIRRAAADDAKPLTKIALEATEHWGYPDRWIEYWDTDLTISPEFIRDHQVYVAEENSEIQGFYALSVSDQAELEQMWVTPALIGTGVGKELLLDAMERAASTRL